MVEYFPLSIFNIYFSIINIYSGLLYILQVIILPVIIYALIRVENLICSLLTPFCSFVSTYWNFHWWFGRQKLTIIITTRVKVLLNFTADDMISVT